MELSRRKFLALLGLGGVGLGLAACSPTATATPTLMPGLNGNGTPTVDEIDTAHENAVKTFLVDAEKNARTFWPPKLPFKLDGATKVFELTCQEVQWETEPGKMVAALAYNGVVPGPEIRVTEGDQVRVIVKNQMHASTAVHWHGVQTPNTMDGVPFFTQPPIKSGATFAYEFVAKPAGSHLYYSQHNAPDQVTRGLVGPIIIEPKSKTLEPKFDSDYILIANDTNLGLTLNGKSFPATAPMTAQVGAQVRLRLMNQGLLMHPMHLHGMYMRVIAQDGAPLANPYLCDTLTLAPGQRADVIVDCQTPGIWPLHCSILNQADSARGMFGLVTALVIK